MEVKDKVETPPENSLAGKGKMTFRKFLLDYNAIIIFIILVIACTIISPIFLKKTNIYTVLRQQVVYLIIAMGALMVIITAGIDLSAPGIASVASIVLCCSISRWGWGLDGGGFDTWIAIALALGSALILGAINGALIAFVNMPAFIVTLAMLYATEGLSYIFTTGNTIMLASSGPAYAQLVGFATGKVFGFPTMVVFAFVIVIICALLMKYTTFGRIVYAIGSNESAVRLAGINSRIYLFFVYLIAGLLSGIGGIILACRSGNASALTAGGDYALSCISGVVIGGASLAGGEGSVLMTVVGVFIIALIGNIMNLINLPTYPQMVVKAVVIILAVLLGSLTEKKRA